jgi:hypothetical protein
MNERMNLELSPTLLDRINAVRMSDADRQAAVDAMRTAHQLVNAWLWLKEKLSPARSGRFLKPTAQH